jgi:hypothetical protein
VNNNAEIIGIVAGIIAFLNVVPYVISIFQKKTKPSRSAYAIWLVIDTVTVASYIASGATDTIWTFLGFGLTTFIIFGLSLKYGMGGFNKLDIICMVIALFAIIIWLTTKDASLALYASLSAKLIGYIPIVKKSYLYPCTENNLAWNMAAFASLLNIVAITSSRPEILIAPVSLAIVDLLIIILLNFPKLRLKTYTPVKL